MYKRSKFNYWCDRKNVLNLYNSYRGLESILRIKDAELRTKVRDFLEGTSDDLNQEIKDILQEKEYLVPDEEDELERINADRLAAINSDRLVLTILPTSGCNFKCVYCYEDFQPKTMNLDTQSKVVEFVRKLLNGKKSLFVNWFGGEPLLAIEVIENISMKLINICREYRITYFAGITTNGYLLNMENFRRMLKCRVIDYQVTIDGLQADHDKLRILKNNMGTYQVIMDNLKKISHEMKKGIFSISIRCNCLKNSMEAYDEIARQYLETFGKDERFSFTVHGVKDWGGESVGVLKNELMTDEEEQQLLKKALGYKCKKSELTDAKICMNTHIAMLDKQTNSCYAIGMNNYVVGADGAIYKCTSDFDKALGTVDNSDVVENWFNYETDYVPDKECDECFFYGACGRRICPKAMKIGKKMCPIEKECVAEILESIRDDQFEQINSSLIYKYMGGK